MTAYKLFWDEFSSWYLECIKPEYQKAIDYRTYHTTIEMFEVLLKILHPFVPFITEEIWHLLKERAQGYSIMYEHSPSVKPIDKEKVTQFEHIKEIVTFIRNTRTEKKIANKDKLKLYIKPVNYRHDFDAVIIKLGNLDGIELITDKAEGSVSFITSYAEFYIPVGELHNDAEEIEKLEKELEYARGFLNSVMQKLNNSSFVSNAPSKVLEIENRKKTDTETRIRAMEEQIASMKK
jgi:valyl-tRNA synthetase